MKYSINFNRDFAWYMTMRHRFNFDGRLRREDVVYDPKGVDGKRAFYLLDSQGKMVPTRHPVLLQNLLCIKGGTNLHIKMYAEDRAKGLMSGIELRALAMHFKAPAWFRQAVERQKFHFM